MNPWELILRYPIEYFHANQFVTFLTVNPLRCLISGNEFTSTPYHPAISTAIVCRHVSHTWLSLLHEEPRRRHVPDAERVHGEDKQLATDYNGSLSRHLYSPFPSSKLPRYIYLLIEYLYRLSDYPNNKLSVILS